MHEYSNLFLQIILGWNIVTLLLYGVDKFRAVHKRYRISEAVLLWVAFLLGGVGAFTGMMLFRHKTQKPKFKILVPIFAVLTVLAALFGYLKLAGKL